MGEVYKATDTRLDRTVALKILPQTLAADPQFLERFDREARAISQLTHPHICTLYDVGEVDAVRFLVMEYLDGESLAARLARADGGALPLNDTLKIATEIASALETAHRAGIVHRDLKPANIFLTRSGAKLLDFGLAKTGVPVVAGASGTMLATTPPNLTAQGTILGTIQYMAPEQIEGQDADARTDIFAFGVCLYEMTTGRKAFAGKTHASLIGSILKDEPPRVSTIQPVTPPALDRVVEACLAKNPDDRFQTAHDLLLQLRWIAEGGSAVGVPAPVAARRKNRERIAWASAAVLALGLAGAGVVAVTHLREEAPQTARFVALPPEKVTSLDAAAISPDGRRLVFVAAQDSVSKLWLRPIDSLTAQPVPGTDGASFPFWSPDSQFVAFFAAGKLKKISAGGGPAQTLSDALNARGGTWSQDGVIVFAPDGSSPLHRVSSAGGASTALTKLDAAKNETTHRWPHFLPDGRHFLYSAGTVGGALDVFLASLDAPTGVALLKAESNAIYAQPGYLLFSREKALLAQRFDAGRGQLLGEAFPVAEGVEGDGSGLGTFGASTTGTLMYRPGSSHFDLTWFDRNGRALGTLRTPEPSDDFDLAGDGRQLTVTGRAPQGTATDIWLVDLARNTSARFTFDAGTHANGTWSPDSSRVAYRLTGPKGDVLAVKDAAGALAPTELAKPPIGTSIVMWDWTRDGRYLVCHVVDPKTGLDLWAVPVGGDAKPFPLVQMSGIQVHAQVSADGRWLAYSSSESGGFDVYVQDFPTPRRRWKISINGGVQPHWRRDGKELFFLAGDGKLMSVPIESGPTFNPGVPVPLFQTRTPGGPFAVTRRHFQPSPDGQRFLVKNVAADALTSSYVLMLNWTSSIKK